MILLSAFSIIGLSTNKLSEKIAAQIRLDHNPSMSNQSSSYPGLVNVAMWTILLLTAPMYKALAYDQETIEPCRTAVVAYPLQPEICAEVLLALKQSQELELESIAETAGLLAIGYARTNNATQSREVIELLLSEQSDSWVAHANHGTMLLYLGQFGQSIVATDRAITLSTQANLTIPDLYLNRALAARGIGEFQNATQAFTIYQELMGHLSAGNNAVQNGAVYGPPESSRRLDRRFGGDPFKASGRVQSR
jgi:tetratricopeptide (TPR) repeat protein